MLPKDKPGALPAGSIHVSLMGKLSFPEQAGPVPVDRYSQLVLTGHDTHASERCTKGFLAKAG